MLSFRPLRVQTSAPGLLLACRQIHQEATSLYYHGTIFVGRSSGVLLKWLKMLPEEYARALQDVRLDAHGFISTNFPSWDKVLAARYTKDVLARVIDVQLVEPHLEHLKGRIRANVWTKSRFQWTTVPVEAYEAAREVVALE